MEAGHRFAIRRPCDCACAEGRYAGAMPFTVRHFHRALSVLAVAAALGSAALQDIDKSPLYLLLAYVFWRLP